jgi:hypothetical protein
MSDGHTPVENVEGTSRLTQRRTAINAGQRESADAGTKIEMGHRIAHFIVDSISSAHSLTISLEPINSDK